MDATRTTATQQRYWGDLHKHMTGPGAPIAEMGNTLTAARAHLDFCAVYCYPFEHYEQGTGLRVETTDHRSQFDEWWARVEEHAREYNEPGSFVTFPAYEWHGDRRRWGDHHVVYRKPGNPLDGTNDVRELSEALRSRPAILIPHHTGYRVGERGKDWAAHDPALSPVMEIYSTHGSSEGVDTPVPMRFNRSMGPRTAGGTFHDALARGHRLGVIASNDGPGVPGAWNRGLMGVWADELSRSAIWEAIGSRRTYGVTGDRITLWWSIDDTPMGSVTDVPTPGRSRAEIQIDCPRKLDRVELLRNGTVVRNHVQQATIPAEARPGRYRILVEFGWGPTTDYAPFLRTDVEWDGSIRLTGGTLHDVAPRFVGSAQSFTITDNACDFTLLTSRDEPSGPLPEAVSRSDRQGLIVEFEADSSTEISVELKGFEGGTFTLSDLLSGPQLIVQYDEAADLLEQVGVPVDALGNMDRRYHVSPKIKLHRPHPVTACSATISWSIDPAPGDAYYVRASQIDGQYAWSSPIWFDL